VALVFGATVRDMTEESTYEFGTSLSSAKDDKKAIGEPTLLARLRSTVEKKVERPDVFIEVPERPGVTVRISPNITQHQMRSWRKNAGEDSKAGFDPTKFSCLVIGHCCTGIFVDGQEVTSENGSPLSFASPEVLNMTDTTRPVPDCVLAFFGIDPHVEAAALAIMEAAGYSDTVETTNPTTTS
jgi:hypothetical protein